jgi:hypothetical protein
MVTDTITMDTCKTAATNRSLDKALEESFPASDPAASAEPAGDARDASGCCCGPAEAPKAKPASERSSCCGPSER